MNAAGHLAEAERLLGQVSEAGWGWDVAERTDATLTAICHALTALAAELGVPHPAAPAGGGGSD